MSQPVTNQIQTPDDHHHGLSALTLGALGIVFGDIGTSPLYAMKESLSEHYGLAINQLSIYGVLSLMFWSAVMVVTLKYVMFIMKADNNGEGGILALMSLTLRGKEKHPQYKWLLILGILGASLFYGDSVITPAISILSAVEGLEVVAPSLHEYIIPIAVVIIFGLFAIQKHGTGVIGKLFGPICFLWFSCLAILGIWQIMKHPFILEALNPWFAVQFFMAYKLKALLVMGSIFLVVTGGEALYADMGHFGRKPIMLAWFSLVFPALMLNYFGQGAFILSTPGGEKNPFFLMIPEFLTFPMVILATFATIIASQAVISGAFSLTSQAIKLGYVPRMKIYYTNAKEIGQIYIPIINWFLLALVLFAVFYFKTSSNLASAYGIAVTTTMLIDDILLLIVMLTIWKSNRFLSIGLFIIFFSLDFAFFGANAVKFAAGGWFPATLGVIIFTILMTWKKGKELVRSKTEGVDLPLIPFIQSLLRHPPVRVEGTALFMQSDLSSVPNSLLHNLKHNKVLHERVIFLSIHTDDVPYVQDINHKIQIQEIEDTNKGAYIIHAHYGFQEKSSIPDILSRCSEHGLDISLMETSFFLNRETVIPSKLPGMAMWREWLFALMMRNSARVTDYFEIPPNRVVELGAQIEI